jgi:hypothetical protein
LLTTRFGRRSPARASGVEVVAAAALTVVLVVATTFLTSRLGGSLAVAAPMLVLLCAFLAVNPRTELNLVIVALYLGLLDGYLKLSTGNAIAPAVRDLLLYAVVVGVLVRLAISDKPVHLPKYTGHVVLFAAIVLVQAVNPATPGIKAVIGGVRQHLEFMPLFFFGYVYMRTERRLEAFLLLLLVVAAASGVVAAIQYNLSPSQFAAWGPGYSDRILGTGDFVGAARTFSDLGGEERIRPFGLGSDIGSAGVIGWSALAAGLALIAVPRRPWLRVAGAVGLAFCVLAVLTAQSKQVVLVAVFVPIAFAALTVTSREAARGLAALLVGGLLVYLVVSVVISGQSVDTSRLGALGSGQLQSTIVQERGHAARLIPVYAASYPFGNGLGRSGPAAGFGGRGSTLNTENEPNFLISEVGTVGLLILLALWLRVIYDGVAAVRTTANTRIRLYLAAIVAAVLGSALSWLSSTPTVSVPTGPLFWFSAGIIAWAAVNGAQAYTHSETHLAADRRERSVTT